MVDQLVALNANDDEEDVQSLPDDLTDTEEYTHELWKLGITESQDEALLLNSFYAEVEKLQAAAQTSNVWPAMFQRCKLQHKQAAD